MTLRGADNFRARLTEQRTGNGFVWAVAPGVGFEPTRPEGPQANSRAYSRHGPALFADCPVPGSGIPALRHLHSKGLFSPLGNRKNLSSHDYRETGVENQSYTESQTRNQPIGKSVLEIGLLKTSYSKPNIVKFSGTPRGLLESRAAQRRRTVRVAMGAGQPTTLDGRMAVLAPGGRHP